MAPSADAPKAFVHVDLDGLWTLAGAYGFPEGNAFQDDPVFRHGLARLLDLLDRHAIKATWFIVGRDLELDWKAQKVRTIAERGHALGNHSYNHWIGMERLGESPVLKDLSMAQEAIARVTGVRPVGFRAPGYDAGPKAWKACRQAGLRYDASRLPTCWRPLLRAYARRLRRSVRAEWHPAPVEPPDLGPVSQYGSGPWWDNRPRRWGGAQTDGGLLCLPLAVSPILRLPLQASFGMLLGAAVTRRALQGLARRGGPILYLLHGLDATAPEECHAYLPERISRRRAFRVPLETRLEFIAEALGVLRRVAEIRTTEECLGALSVAAGRGA